MNNNIKRKFNRAIKKYRKLIFIFLDNMYIPIRLFYRCNKCRKYFELDDIITIDYFNDFFHKKCRHIIIEDLNKLN